MYPPSWPFGTLSAIVVVPAESVTFTGRFRTNA
jgi:ribosomal protein L13